MTPLEPNFEFVHAWGQLVPLLDSNPEEAARLLDDRDRALVDWLLGHEHETGDAPEAAAIEQTQWFMFGDVDVAPGTDQVLEFDNSDTLSGDPFLSLDASPGVFFGNHPDAGGLIRTRYLVTVTCQLEDTDAGHWDLWVERAGDPSFSFGVERRYLQRTDQHNDGPTGISAALLLVNPNPDYWRYGVTLSAGSATDQAIIAEPNPVVSHQLVWWAFIDE